MSKYEKQSIKKYDSVAANYDQTMDGRFTAKFKQKMLELCEVSDGDDVLDVGCGNGSLIHAISKKADIQAHGVDISPKMIEECKARYDGIYFEVSNGEILNFEDESLDAVTICCVLHHLDNPQSFMREAHRLLKQGGILLIGEPKFPLIIRKLFDWIISPLMKAGDNKLFSHKRLKRLIIDGGFEIVEIHKKGFMQTIKARKVC